MARAASDLLSDARDVARRNAIPFLVITAGLILVWSTTLEESRRGFRADERALSTSSIKAEKTRQVIDRIRQQRSQTSLQIQRSHSNASEACAARRVGDCKNATVELAAAQRRYSDLGTRFEEPRKIAGELAQSIRQIRARLAEKVSFDLGQGIRLPFTLLVAPLAWLLVLAFLLVRLAIVRALFWRLVAQAAVRGRLDGVRPAASGLIEIPFWLGPAPRGRGAGLKDAALHRIVGWRNSARSRRFLLYVVLTIGALVALRVCWLGIFFESVSRLPNELLGGLGQPPETDRQSRFWSLLGTATALVAVVDILLLVWLAMPARGTIRAPAPAPVAIGRREMIVLGLGVVGYAFLAFQLSASAVQGKRKRLLSNLERKMLRFKARRNKTRQAAAPELQPGWYFNKRTSAAHWLPRDKIIKNARGLKPGNLERVNFAGPDLDAPGLWVRKEYATRIREEVALQSLTDGSVWLAMNVLVFAPLSAREGIGTTTRRLDLAAGMVIWLGWENGLRQVTDTARRIAATAPSANLRTLLQARIERWNGSSGAKWRQSRWSGDRALRWADRKIERAQIGPLVFDAREGDGP